MKQIEKAMWIGCLICALASSASIAASYIVPISSPNRWPVSATAPVVIDVCFESFAEETVGTTPGTVPVSLAQNREWVAEAIRTTWGRHGRILFNFNLTSACGSNSTAIRIGWTDAGPMTTGGYSIRGAPNGMLLASFKSSAQRAGCNSSQWELCIKGDAIHEFGHLLGFMHEEERPDFELNTGCDTGNGVATIAGGQLLGAFDIHSVMSVKCGRLFKDQPFIAANQFPNFPDGGVDTDVGRKLELSVGDIAALQKVFGMHQAGSLMTDQRCLSAHWFSASAPSYPFTYDCDEYSSGQEWWFVPLGTANQTRVWVYPNLAPSTPTTLDGFYGTFLPVEIRSSGWTQHEWLAEVTSIVGFGGLCLDVWGGTTSSDVKVAWCAGARNPLPVGRGGLSQNQNWKFNYAINKIQWAANTAYCLSPNAGSMANGTKMSLVLCGSAATFQFGWGGNLLVTSGGTTKCVDIQGATESAWLNGMAGQNNGATVQVWDCAPVPAQQWHFRTRLRNLDSNLCLDSNGGSQLQTPNGQTCNADPLFGRQLWEYYPGHLSNY